MKDDQGRATAEVATGPTDVSFDLTDEVGLLTEDFVALNPDGVRALLAALNLAGDAEVAGPVAAVYDLAIYRATRCVHLSEFFHREFRGGP